jgi:hypothetical protein
MFFSVFRKKNGKNPTFVKAVNEFGVAQGFAKILERFQDKNNRLSYENMSNFLKGLSSMHVVLFRSFAQEFIP